MTAHPDPTSFAYLPSTDKTATVSLHPNLNEQFWGYELRMNETALSFALVMRAASGFVTLVCLIAAFGIWFMPGQVAFGGGFLSTALAMALLLCVAVMFARVAQRGTQVRVQIDTVNGELREVVSSGFEGAEVLASYGMDAVRDLRIVASASDAGFGQIHAEIDGYGIVPLADGAVGPLKVLKDRIAQDCGLEGHGQRIAEWSGPLHG